MNKDEWEDIPTSNNNNGWEDIPTVDSNVNTTNNLVIEKQDTTKFEKPSVYGRFISGLEKGIGNVGQGVKELPYALFGMEDVSNIINEKSQKLIDDANKTEEEWKQYASTVKNTDIEDATELNNTIRSEYENYINDVRKNMPSNTPEQRDMRLMKIASLQLEMKNKLAKVPISELGTDIEKTNIAGKIGEATPDIAAAYLTKNMSALPQAVAEGTLSYSKTGDIKEATKDAILSYAVNKTATDLIPNVTKLVKTKFGKDIDKLSLDEQKSLNTALDAMDNAGIDKMDEKARATILNEIDFTRPTEEVSKDVLSSIKDARKNARQYKDDLYTEAYNIGDTTPTDNILGSIKQLLVDNRGKAITAKSLTSDQSDTYKDIYTILNRRKSGNASDFEVTLRELKDLKSSDDPTFFMVKKVVDDLEAKQKNLLSQVNKENAFTDARQADMDYKTMFYGKGNERQGTTSGKAIASVMEAQDKYNVSSQLLSQKIDPNIAEGLVQHIPEQTRRDMVMDVLSKGIDKEALDSPEGVKVLMTNYSKADPDGLKILLGETRADELKKNMMALGVIQEAITTSGKFNNSISKDVLNLASAAAAAKVSPYASVHVAINSAKNIASKGLLKNKKLELIKRVQEETTGDTKRTLLRGLSMIPIGQDDTLESE